MRWCHLCVFFSLLAAAPLGACTNTTGGSGSDQNGPGGGGMSYTTYCSSACQKVHTCDATQDQSTCTNTCDNSFAVKGPKLRSELISNALSCYEGKDCASVLSGTAESDCWNSAAAALAPTNAAKNLCDGLGSADAKCGYTLDQAACLNDAKQYNNATLNGAETCLSRACSDMGSCLGAALAESTSSSSSGDNSCQYAYDGVCDEPDTCAPGTDTADCSGG